jgi:hypothetical protein
MRHIRGTLANNDRLLSPLTIIQTVPYNIFLKIENGRTFNQVTVYQ